MIKRQVVAAYASKVPYVGLFGLSTYNNHVNNSLDAEASPLRTLQNANKIPSYYYAYTAGARYHNVRVQSLPLWYGTSAKSSSQPPVFASLTLGGYDAARGNTDGRRLSASLGAESTRELLVTIASITINDGTDTTTVDGLGTDTVAYIDSLLPEIRLPAAACQSFESAFGLVYNETVGYYLVNDTQHNTLIQQAKTVTFSLTNGTGAATNIVLPYAAFDLGLQYPLANITDNTTTLRYFPLQRASNSDENILGRTFLQEA